jgi:hypothetical protein
LSETWNNSLTLFLYCGLISFVTLNVSSSKSLPNITKNSGVTASNKCEKRTAVTKPTTADYKNGNLQKPEVILKEKSELSFCGNIHNLHLFCSKAQCIPSSQIPHESRSEIALLSTQAH